jgi:SAM-dependent methyltransferase
MATDDLSGVTARTGATPPVADQAAVVAYFGRRTAGQEAAFFVPHLRPGLRVLDVGCGPGSITVGLAAAVAPGEVVGVDADPERVALARERAAQAGAGTVRVERADVHALPFPAASFDAALVHAVLEHLPDPAAALREVHRVLKPGGVVGARSPDYGSGVLLYPPDPLLDEVFAWHARLKDAEAGIGAAAAAGGGRMGRALRAALRAAGFRDVTGSASMDCAGTAAETRRIGAVWAAFVGTARFRAVADAPTRERAAAAWRAWSAHPDAFFATPWGEAIGWA